MIKVLDQEKKQAIKIEVCGLPYQWRLRLGKMGKWTPKIGKNKGIEQTGIRYGHESYHGNLREVLRDVQQRLSEELGLPEKDQVIEGIEGWNRAIKEEERLVAVTEMVHLGFSDFLEKYGEQLRDMSSKTEVIGVPIEKDEEGESIA